MKHTLCAEIVLGLLLPIAKIAATVTCPVPANVRISTEAELSDNAKLTRLMTALNTSVEPSPKAEQFIACLPEEYRRRFVMVTESGSMQGATPQAPRVLLYGNSGKTIISFSPVQSPDSVEILQYEDRKGSTPRFQWTPKVFAKNATSGDFDFSYGVGSAAGGHGGTQSCTACHGNPVRPKFDSYDRWPNTYSTISVRGRDAILPNECQNYTAFLDSTAADKASPYSTLPLQRSRDVERLPNGVCMVRDGAGPSPAGHLNHLLNEMNMHRVADSITSNPQYQRYKYLFQSASRGCGFYRAPNNQALASVGGDEAYAHSSAQDLFGQGMPPDVHDSVNCQGLRRQMAVTVENNFLKQVQDLGGSACAVPNNADITSGTNESGGSKADIFRQRESDTGIFYFILPKTICDPATQTAATCEAQCLTLSSTAAGREQLRPMKLVEALGSARFEQAVQFCCAAKAMGQDCRDWSYATRGRTTGAYEFEDGLSGILQLGEILMNKEKDALEQESITTSADRGFCCPDVQVYETELNANPIRPRRCRPYDYSGPNCGGVITFIYGPRNKGLPPGMPSICNDGSQGLAEYQQRGRECYLLAERSRRAIESRNPAAASRYNQCFIWHPIPFALEVDGHAVIRTVAQTEMAQRYGQQLTCPAPSYQTNGMLTSDIDRIRPLTTSGQSRGGTTPPLHPLMTGPL